jgi:alkylated DNA repair dioxygenase AlkB
MLTFGEGRFLEFKPKNWLIAKHPEAERRRVETPAGSLLVMSGLTQKNWTHGLPKARGQRDRITLTFRTIQ